MTRAPRMKKSRKGDSAKTGVGAPWELAQPGNVLPEPRWDIMSPEKRSALMGRIRGKDTKPEMIVRRLLHSLGYRFRVHSRDLPGRPDIVFRPRRVAIFVHGCFWHRHDCGLAYTPKTRQQFWRAKFDRNVKRDQEVRDELETAGWRVIVVWECQLKKPSALSARLVKSLGPPRRAENLHLVRVAQRLARR
jgi:DNA mismatch endonuclease (patch repair protein)